MEGKGGAGWEMGGGSRLGLVEAEPGRRRDQGREGGRGSGRGHPGAWSLRGGARQKLRRRFLQNIRCGSASPLRPTRAKAYFCSGTRRKWPPCKSRRRASRTTPSTAKCRSGRLRRGSCRGVGHGHGASFRVGLTIGPAGAWESWWGSQGPHRSPRSWKAAVPSPGPLCCRQRWGCHDSSRLQRRCPPPPHPHTEAPGHGVGTGKPWSVCSPAWALPLCSAGRPASLPSPAQPAPAFGPGARADHPSFAPSASGQSPDTQPHTGTWSSSKLASEVSLRTSPSASMTSATAAA